MTPLKKVKNIRKLLKALSPEDRPIIVAEELKEKVEEVISKIPQPKDGEDGEDGKTPSKEELIKLIKPLIPEPKKGDKGERGEVAEVDVEKIKREVKREVLSVISDFPRGGGNMNREILVNSSVLSQSFGDINFLGSGVTLSTSNDVANKRVNLTITGAAGGVEWGDITGTLSDQTDLQTALDAKQATLVSGTNIKTINSTSLLGSGDISISTTPGGSDTQVQFNDGGSFGGDAGFTYDKTSNVGTIGGMLVSGLTASELVATDGSKNLQSLAVATYPSLTELSYVKGVTSAIQTQINAKFTLPSLTSGSVIFSNGTTLTQDNANLFWDDTNNRLGIGLSTLAMKLGIKETGAGILNFGQPSGNSTFAGFGVSQTTSAQFTTANYAIISNGTSTQLNAATGGTVDVRINNTEVAKFTSSTIVFNDGAANVSFRAEGVGDTDLFFIDAANNRVGVSTVSPTHTFHVDGTVKLRGALSINTADEVTIDGLNLSFATGGFLNVHTTFAIRDIDTAFAQYFVVTPTAMTYSGSITTQSQFTVVANSTPTVQLRSTIAHGIDVGVTIQMGGYYDLNATCFDFALIKALKENAVDGDFAGYLSFFTRANGPAAAEVMRLTSARRVGIGTTAPDKQVEINSSTGACLRLTYNDSNGSAANYTDLEVSSSGDLTITPSGGDVAIVGDLTLSAKNIITDTTTGMKVGTGATQKLGFFGATPVVQQTELTDELTTITFTAPGTPDYAIQDLVDSSGGAAFGFKTKDEGNTVLSVIANLQARVNELETKLVTLGFLADAD